MYLCRKVTSALIESQPVELEVNNFRHVGNVGPAAPHHLPRTTYEGCVTSKKKRKIRIVSNTGDAGPPRKARGGLLDDPETPGTTTLHHTAGEHHPHLLLRRAQFSSFDACPVWVLGFHAWATATVMVMRRNYGWRSRDRERGRRRCQ